MSLETNLELVAERIVWELINYTLTSSSLIAFVYVELRPVLYPLSTCSLCLASSFSNALFLDFIRRMAFFCSDIILDMVDLALRNSAFMFLTEARRDWRARTKDKNGE